MVGSALAGQVIIVDDVITAGTAVRESMQLLQAANAPLAGVLIALDRQERGHILNKRNYSPASNSRRT